ncbi:MAG: ROK family protein [Clostridia bacterium]|nr:ROK family protein [Clostridia bacterium]
MSEVILALDCGGSSIKAAVIRDKDILETRLFPFEGDGREDLLGAFRAAAEWGASWNATRIGAACPGPFDFNEGASRMVHKWQGIKDVPLAPVLNEALPGVPVRFLHDSTAYMLGEAWDGAGESMQSPAGVMLGTGFGYALMQDRLVLLDETQTPLVRLWNAPFKGGIVEDFVSTRAIRKRYTDATGKEADVKQIADLAHAGDETAIEVFRETGRLLGEILTQYLPEWADGVVLGGRIALSGDLFLPYANTPVPVVAAKHVDDAALRGIAAYCMRERDQLVREVHS